PDRSPPRPWSRSDGLAYRMGKSHRKRNSNPFLAMKRRQFLATGTTLASGALLATGSAAISPRTTDVFVYGSTPGGLAAAIEAARRGCKVILACPKMHAGGMTAS